MAREKGWKPGVTQQKILDAAVEVLDQKGYHECSIDVIAEKAGIGKGTVYLYYKSKEELYYSLLFRLVEEMVALVEKVHADGGTAEEQVTALFSALTAFGERERHIMMLLREEMKTGRGELHARLLEAFNRLLKTISRIMEKGMHEKVFKEYPPELAAMILMGMASVLLRTKVRASPELAAAAPGLVTDFFMAGIRK